VYVRQSPVQKAFLNKNNLVDESEVQTDSHVSSRCRHQLQSTPSSGADLTGGFRI
jgi:hypothetical protein